MAKIVRAKSVTLAWLRLDTLLMLDLSRRIDTPVVLKMLNLKEGDLVLDVGCGDGKQIVRLRKATTVVGLEIERPAAIFAKRRSHSVGIRNIHLVVGDAQNMPFKDSVFNKVLCNCTLEHIPDDRRAINEVRRVLIADGFFVLTVPNEMKRLFDNSLAIRFMSRWPQSVSKIFLKKYLHPYLNNLRDTSRIIELLEKTQRHFHCYTQSSLKKMLVGDFKVVRIINYEKIFGAAAQNIKYLFRGDLHFVSTTFHILFPVLFLLSMVDRLVPDYYTGSGIAVKAIKRQYNI